MEIRTKRFLLRDFVAEDAPAFEAYHSDPRSLELYGPEQARPGHAQELLDLFKTWAAEQPRLNYQLAIVRCDDSQTLIGCCGLRTAGSEPGSAELGIELAPEFWGRYRYAIEVIQALVEFGFGKLGLEKIYGSTVSANSRIARLAESSGATSVTKPAPAWMAAKGWEQVEWQITKEQWSRHRRTRHFSRPATPAPEL